MADEVEAKEEKKGGGNGMMIVLVVLIVVLLAAVGGIGYFLYSKGMFDPEAAPGAQQVEQKQEVASEEEEGEKFLAQVDSLVLNVTDAKGRAKLMKLSFTMKTTEPTIEVVVETNKAEIKVTEIVIGNTFKYSPMIPLTKSIGIKAEIVVKIPANKGLR